MQVQGIQLYCKNCNNFTWRSPYERRQKHCDNCSGELTFWAKQTFFSSDDRRTTIYLHCRGCSTRLVSISKYRPRPHCKNCGKKLAIYKPEFLVVPRA